MKNPIKTVSPEAKVVMRDYHKEKAKKYGTQYIEPTQPKWFVSYPFIVAIMTCLQVLTILYGRKFVMFFGFNISAGSLILLPVVMYIFQITAECYGWQYSRQIVWCNFIINAITTIVCFTFKLIPYSPFNHAGLENAYVSLVDTMWVSASLYWGCVFFSDYAVSVLMCSSRFHWNGKFMVMRLVVLHLLSEAIILAGNFISMPYNGYSVSETWQFVGNAFIARTIMSIMLLPVARFVIWFIQHKVEKVVVFDLSARFNLFKFDINPADSVQFNANGWDKIDSGKINLKKMAEYYSNGILEEQQQKLADSINSRNPEHQQE